MQTCFGTAPKHQDWFDERKTAHNETRYYARRIASRNWGKLGPITGPLSIFTQTHAAAGVTRRTMLFDETFEAGGLFGRYLSPYAGDAPPAVSLPIT
ncbi:unnamed protein product, partial [Iphiclides podalirius]